jgi:hypothetical protein
MARVDQLLAAVDASAEFEVIRYDAVESSRDSRMVSSRRNVLCVKRRDTTAPAFIGSPERYFH